MMQLQLQRFNEKLWKVCCSLALQSLPFEVQTTNYCTIKLMVLQWGVYWDQHLLNFTCVIWKIEFCWATTECPDRYKRSVIRAYLHRAHKTCSSDHLLRQETLRIKQILINNWFTKTDVDREISKFHIKPISDEQNLKVFSENQMSDDYKVDEFPHGECTAVFWRT